MRIYTIKEAKTARQIMLAVWETVKAAVAGGPVEIIIQRPNKTRAQERTYHAMIRDIMRQVDTDRGYDFEVWKALLVHAYDVEMKNLGTPLRHPGRVVPSLDGLSVVAIRPSTSLFTVAEGSGFIDYLSAWGAEYGVKFREVRYE